MGGDCHARTLPAGAFRLRWHRFNDRFGSARENRWPTGLRRCRQLRGERPVPSRINSGNRNACPKALPKSSSPRLSSRRSSESDAKSSPTPSQAVPCTSLIHALRPRRRVCAARPWFVGSAPSSAKDGCGHADSGRQRWRMARCAARSRDHQQRRYEARSLRSSRPAAGRTDR